jgi:hypothetical protein
VSDDGCANSPNADCLVGNIDRVSAGSPTFQEQICVDIVVFR